MIRGVASGLGSLGTGINLARTFGLPYILGASGAAVSNTATTNEEALAVIQVPANALGANGSVKVDATLTTTNSGNTKTVRVRFGTAADLTGTALRTISATTSASLRLNQGVQNRNATNSQVGSDGSQAGGSYTTSGTAVATSAIDTTAITYLVISGQKQTAGEVLTLERYDVVLMYKA